MATILMPWCICVAINCPYAYTLVKRDLPLRIACMRQLFQHGQLQLFFQLFDRRFFYLSPSLQWKLNEEKFDRKIWYVVTKGASKGPEIWNASELRYSCTISIFPSYNFFPHEKNVRAHFGLKRDHNNNNNEKNLECDIVQMVTILIFYFIWLEASIWSQSCCFDTILWNGGW